MFSMGINRLCVIFDRMRLVDFLVRSKGQRLLLGALYEKGLSGPVAELARVAGLRYSQASRELDQMHALGMVKVQQKGNARLVQLDPNYPHQGLLRSLLSVPEAKVDEDRVQGMRSVLAYYGAQLVSVFPPPDRLPSATDAVLQSLTVLRDDPAMAGTLPVVLWKHRAELDPARLVEAARAMGEGQRMGFVLEMTAHVSGDERFAHWAATLRDKRVRRTRNFFRSDGMENSPYHKQMLEMHTPDLARRWGFSMNMSMQSFQDYFRKGTSANVRLE
jgi:hypothetical protein